MCLSHFLFNLLYMQLLTSPLSKTYNLEIVGMYYYPKAKSSIRQGSPVQLVRDPHNPFDVNAIRVVFLGSNVTIGHLSKHRAAKLAPKIDSGEMKFDSAVVSFLSPNKTDAAVTFRLVATTQPAASLPTAAPAVAAVPV